MSNALMAPRKNKRSQASRAIAQTIIDQHQPANAEEIQDAHPGYSPNDHGSKDTDNRRIGYDHKNLKTTYGNVAIAVPRNRDATFEPQAVPKRTKDVSDIEGKVLSVYACGISERDIADTIEDIYGFGISHEAISNITDRVVETVEEWQNHPLRKFYTFLFVDCLYVSIRKETDTKSCAVYVILGYDVNGEESSHFLPSVSYLTKHHRHHRTHKCRRYSRRNDPRRINAPVLLPVSDHIDRYQL